MRSAPEQVWILLTALFTSLAGWYEATGERMLAGTMPGLWFFIGILLAACRPGERRKR